MAGVLCSRPRAEARGLLHEAVELLEISPAWLDLAHALEHLGGPQLPDGDRTASGVSFRHAAALAAQLTAAGKGSGE